MIAAVIEVQEVEEDVLVDLEADRVEIEEDVLVDLVEEIETEDHEEILAAEEAMIEDHQVDLENLLTKAANATIGDKNLCYNA